ncbi:hypothetical protein [Propionicicella superfundia]|uniref:hypothetical protein n=1 Tax=Propionicicella superfundia TaxID=348582 RepID=UPI00048EEF8B|nr:hypothetical protein [Propionicicella superfundia]
MGKTSIRPGAGWRLLASAMAVAALTTGCTSTPGITEPPATSPSADGTRPASTASPSASGSATLPVLAIRSDDDAVERASGHGRRSFTYTVDSGTYAMYLVCRGSSAVSVSASGATSTWEVPCDEVVSRRMIVTEPATVDVTLDAADATEWAFVFAVPR